MPHSPQDKKRAITRLRRINGQVQALERAVEQESPCGELLQQLAALRGAVNGLMAEVLETHLHETFSQHPSVTAPQKAQTLIENESPSSAQVEKTATTFNAQEEIQLICRIIRTYLK